MTKKGLAALRRTAKKEGWPHDMWKIEAFGIDRTVNRFLAEDPNVTEQDRHWLEVAVRAPGAAPLLFALHYRGVRPGETIQ